MIWGKKVKKNKMNKTANGEQFLQKIKLLDNILESRMVWIHMSFRPREK